MVILNIIFIEIIILIIIFFKKMNQLWHFVKVKIKTENQKNICVVVRLLRIESLLL